MSRSRLPLILGGTAVAGVGYYLYNAGGSPKAAEKQFESTFCPQPLTIPSKRSAIPSSELKGPTLACCASSLAWRHDGTMN